MNAAVDITEISIETERLLLRSWNTKDVDDLFEYASVPGVGEMAGWPHHSSLEDSRKILELFIQEKKTFALVWKQTGKVIGSLGLEKDAIDPVQEELFGREIGYVLSKQFWGMGLMTEAVKAVISYCFQTLHFDYLTCGHFLNNNRSRRVIEKCGFHFLRTIQYETTTGSQEPTQLYIMYNPDKRGSYV